MANLVIPRREILTSQPTADVRVIDEFCRGVVFLPSIGVDLISGKAPGGSGTGLGKGANQDGLFNSLDGTGTGKYEFAIKDAPAYSVVWCGEINGIGASTVGRIFSTLGGSGGHELYHAESALNFNTWFSAGSGQGYFPVSIGIGIVCIVVTYDASNGTNRPDVWMNGIKQVLTGGTASGTRLAGGAKIAFGGRATSTDRQGNHKINLAAYAPIKIGAELAQSLSENPWQIFAPRETRLFVPVGGGGSVNANASGALSAVSVAAPSASASGGASASGALATITISYPTATASAGGSASASGSFASLTLAAPNATATASGVGAGSFAALSISPATATATATKSATASGAFAAISLSAPNATATGTTAGNTIATATPAQITINPTTASAIGSAVASGAFAALSITPPTATATSAGDAHAIAAFAALSINPTTGAAYGSAIATGSLPVISLSPATGTASTGTFTGSISAADITRIVQAVLAALHATSIPVTGNWPTANQIATATLNEFNSTTQSVDVVSINGVPVVGAGTKVSAWRPA